MEIKVFGTGCTRCNELEQMVKELVNTRTCGSKVLHVTDLKEMMSLGVFSTPAVMVNGVLKCSGRVPTQAEVANWLDEVSS